MLASPTSAPPTVVPSGQANDPASIQRAKIIRPFAETYAISNLGPT
jgi:hypothetical protein